MSFLLSCPNCGERRVDEFRFGGEYRERPTGDLAPAAWAAYLYDRANVAGSQQEWWYHRQGCKRWFIATRDTTINTVLESGWLAASKGARDAQEPDPHATAATREPDPGP